MKPLIYQKLHKKLSDDESLAVMKSIDPVFKGPMIVGALSLWLGSTIIVAACDRSTCSSKVGVYF